jgi:hypothetical protein
MSRIIALVLLVVPAALVVSRSSTADSRPALYLAAGATGGSEGFRGGWGFTALGEFPVRPSANFVVRADYHVVPDVADDLPAEPWVRPAGAQSVDEWFGRWPAGAERLEMSSLLAGFRLRAPSERLQTYVDALVGLGHVPAAGETDPRIRQDTNFALSLGAGVKLRGAGPLLLFADAHYDFYLVPGRTQPIVPLRLGFGIPLGRGAPRSRRWPSRAGASPPGGDPAIGSPGSAPERPSRRAGQ